MPVLKSKMRRLYYISSTLLLTCCLDKRWPESTDHCEEQAGPNFSLRLNQAFCIISLQYSRGTKTGDFNQLGRVLIES